MILHGVFFKADLEEPVAIFKYADQAGTWLRTVYGAVAEDYSIIPVDASARLMKEIPCSKCGGKGRVYEATEQPSTATDKEIK